ncbi:tRNA/rRNA methyltransferase (SpoU) [Gracilinema caldarium DSM 7334]|uniref:tRNA/rRNA methyltransferase (SpoU) n=2 Tax=Gracilinema caldarium TaxID=215591 RepID=F8F2A4_GRAC1|nr:tRNA/rRNA methyltransferase (SpoU) [Gracilinema caldarium DSM 7334]
MAELDLAWFAELKDRELRKERIIIAEGRLVAERTAAFCDALGILCVPAALEDAEAISRGTIPIQVLSEAEISKLAGYPFHRGLLFAARRPELQPLSEAGTLVASGQRLVVLPQITDPENLGAIIRTAAALGWDGILLGPRSADPYSRRVLRCSMAAVFALPIYTFHGAGELELLASTGWELWAAMLSPDSCSPESLRQVKKLALMLGNERFGLSQEMLNRSCAQVTIPQRRFEVDAVDSLNVAAAAAILLWEGRPGLISG